MSLRLLLLLCAAALGATTATATAAEVAGPAGVRVERPATSVTCPTGVATMRTRVSVRFTAASTRRRVRSVRVVVQGTRSTKALAARRGTTRRAQFAVPCGRTFTIRFEARDARRRVLARRSFRVTSRRAAPDDAAEAGDDARQTDPFAAGPPPGAQSRDEGTGTTWTTSVDVRRTGTRAGQVCAQVSSTTADNRRTVVPTYCGILTEDPFFVRTQEATDAAGRRRLILGGVANPDAVASVAVNGQNLPLSPAREGMPGSGGGFIAVFDPAATSTESLTLTVTLTNGTVQEFSSPWEINLRAANGSRL